MLCFGCCLGQRWLMPRIKTTPNCARKPTTWRKNFSSSIPFKQKDDAERAVQAAIAMTHRFRSLLTLYDDFPTADIELKILLHCGDVVTAQIGSENRKDFACFGTASTQANLIMRMLDRMGIYLTDRVIMELEHPYGLNPTNLNTGTEVQIYQMADY